MSAANSSDTSHSIVDNSQLGQNLLSEIQINPFPITRYTVVRKLCCCLDSEQSSASVLLPFLMQPGETYNHRCHCSLTSNQQKKVKHKHEQDFLLFKEKDGNHNDDDDNYCQYWSHDPQHFRLIHPLFHLCCDLDRV